MSHLGLAARYRGFCRHGHSDQFGYAMDLLSPVSRTRRTDGQVDFAAAELISDPIISGSFRFLENLQTGWNNTVRAGVITSIVVVPPTTYTDPPGGLYRLTRRKTI